MTRRKKVAEPVPFDYWAHLNGIYSRLRAVIGVQELECIAPGALKSTPADRANQNIEWLTETRNLVSEIGNELLRTGVIHGE